MDHRAGSVFRAFQVLLAFVLVVAASAWAGNRHDLSFSYSVEQEPGSGPLVHVSFHLQLTNWGQDPISIRKLSVLHIHQVGQAQLSTITMQPHSSQQMTQELTLPRAEFERWQKDVGPKLLLEVQCPGSKFIEAVQPDRLQAVK